MANKKIIDLPLKGSVADEDLIFIGSPVDGDLSKTSKETFLTEIQASLDGKADITLVEDEITTVIGGAPTNLNTLDKLAGSLGDDPAFSTTVSTLLSLKAPNLITGYTSGAGVVTADDTVLQAIQKINGNTVLKANADSPTFTGTVVLPSTTSIGGVSSTEIGYLDGVISNIQAQLDNKIDEGDTEVFDPSLYVLKAGGTFTGDIIVPEEVYGVGWNESLEVPTKNSVYDKIESVLNSTFTIISTKTSAYTLLTTDSIILADASSASFTLTLPAASTVNKPFTIKKIDSSANTVTIDANASETIDGDLTQVLSSQWVSITIVSNGTAWFII